MEEHSRSTGPGAFHIVATALLSAVATEVVVVVTAIMTTMLTHIELEGGAVFWSATFLLTPLAALAGGLLAARRPRRTFLPVWATIWAVALAAEIALAVSGLPGWAMAAGLAACVLLVPTAATSVYALTATMIKRLDPAASAGPGIVATALLSMVATAVIGAATAMMTSVLAGNKGFGQLALLVTLVGTPLAGVIGALVAGLRLRRTFVSIWVTFWVVAIVAEVGFAMGPEMLRAMSWAVGAMACVLLVPASATAVYALMRRLGRRPT